MGGVMAEQMVWLLGWQYGLGCRIQATLFRHKAAWKFVPGLGLYCVTLQ